MKKQAKFVYVDQTVENPPRIFYVGKGTSIRIRNFKRNKKHAAMSERFGLQRIVILSTFDEQFANEFEIAKIFEHKTLAKSYHISDDDFGCNFTKGGEGFSGVSECERNSRKERMLSRWSDKEQRKQLTQIQNTFEVKNKKSLASKAWVKTVEGREHLKHSLELARAAIKTEDRIKGQNQLETKNLKSELMKKYCENSDVKKKKSTDAKRNWSSPDYREKQKNSRKDWKPSEEHKKRITEKLKAYWERKRAASINGPVLPPVKKPKKTKT